MTELLPDAEKKKIRDEARILGRQKRWEAKNVSLQIQKTIEAKSVEELQQYIASGAATGPERKFTEMTLNRKRQSSHP